MADSLVVCHACGREHGFQGQLPRSSVCEGCGRDLRCCLNCSFHDETAYNECAETSADRVVDKERANFCDYFSAASAARAGSGATGSSALDELEGLFGGDKDD